MTHTVAAKIVRDSVHVEVREGKRRLERTVPVRGFRMWPARAARELAQALFPHPAEPPPPGLAKAIVDAAREAIAGHDEAKRPKGRPIPQKERLRRFAREALEKRPSLEIENGEALLIAYRTARRHAALGSDPGDPGKHPDADRPPARVGDPIDLQVLALVQGYRHYPTWRDGGVGDFAFGELLYEDVEAEWLARPENDLPVTLYGPMEPLCEAEREALAAIGNTDDEEGRLLGGMKRADVR